MIKLKINTKKIKIILLNSLIIAFSSLIIFPKFALAYVDPSVMTYTIQALAGVAVALSAVLSVALRRSRRFLMKKLGIDENANKDIEIEVVKSENRLDSPINIKSRKNKHKDINLKLRSRIIFSLIASFSTTLTVFFVPMLDVIIGSKNSLIIDANMLIPIAIIFSIVVFVMLFVILVVCRGKLFDILFVIVGSIALCVWLQLMFLNGTMPTANGAELNVTIMSKRVLIGLAVWIIIIIGALVLTILKRKIGRNTFLIICSCLLVVQCFAAIGSLVKLNETDTNNSNATNQKLVVTNDGLSSVSTKNNVIVFVLDALDNNQVNEYEKMYPDIYDGFDGFTRYPDSSGAYIPTALALPYLMTGEEIKYEETYSRYYTRRFEDSSFIKDIYNNGYSVGLYSDTFSGGEPYFKDYTLNIKPNFTISLNNVAATKKLLKCVGFKTVPWIIKSPFWFNTDEINNSIINKDDSNASNPYTINDYEYYTQLKSNKKLETSDTAEKGAFRLIHLNGNHYPCDMDENMNHIEEPLYSDEARAAKAYASFKIVKEYIDQLKALNLYKDTTLLVIADHGNPVLRKQEQEKPVDSPILFIKPAGANTGILQQNHKALTQKVFHSTVLKALGINYEKYGPALDEYNNTGDRYCIEFYGDPVIEGIEEYKISGNVQDINSWSKTGYSWDINK
ncbi:MAG: sulfatase-like hydrolase/transferase [Coriobacteriales bacterium]|nr:sulfatase-like hydrolase/transferase [Coriobacteriales bacterium]